MTEEQKQQAATKRVERNRHFARENRRKKKAYICLLENRIGSLSAELNACKAKLAEYESHYTPQSFQEFCQRVRIDTQRFEELRLQRISALALHSADASKVIPALNASLGEKIRMVDTMSRTLVEFLVTFPYQSAVLQVKDRRREESTHRLEELLRKVPEADMQFQTAVIPLQDGVKRYFEAVEDIKERVARLDLYLAERLVPELRQGTLEWKGEIAAPSGECETR